MSILYTYIKESISVLWTIYTVYTFTVFIYFWKYIYTYFHTNINMQNNLFINKHIKQKNIVCKVTKKKKIMPFSIYCVQYINLYVYLNYKYIVYMYVLYLYVYIKFLQYIMNIVYCKCKNDICIYLLEIFWIIHNLYLIFLTFIS